MGGPGSGRKRESEPLRYGLKALKRVAHPSRKTPEDVRYLHLAYAMVFYGQDMRGKPRQVFHLEDDES